MASGEVIMKRKKCFLVCGNFRGGTSAVAQLLVRMGIDMGSHFDAEAGNYECMTAQQYFLDALMDKLVPLQFNAEMKQYFQRRNDEASGDWGLKFPALHQFLPDLLKFLPTDVEPYIIFVFRDPVAVSMSEYMRNEDIDPKIMMQRTIQFNATMIEKGIVLGRSGIECFPVSFEHLLTRTEEVVDELLTFTGRTHIPDGKKKILVNSIKLKENRMDPNYAVQEKGGPKESGQGVQKKEKKARTS